MQIMLIAILFIILVAYIIYKVNGKFEGKEFAILITVLVLSGILTYVLIEDKKQEVPEIFKTKYENTHNVKISKFTFERLNNKTVSSKTNFIYDFDFITLKAGEEYLCSVKNVKAVKIEDEFVFENFDNLNEKCTKK
ncbi:hypothetical protein CRV01_09210 [Arcobacter sp. CECT 8983]|uniref:hypothetical protein n=1 Tax=Arcobacter sp. CECT 8983 TaxID=2044508 RepID=UPI00100BDF08|nr:hypothetical protein [Arcobacter sp. CECT 8983]RXJ88793.1 hypothetical protein CRV01_09210 [Arcobacter sp. CECT 8983]